MRYFCELLENWHPCIIEVENFDVHRMADMWTVYKMKRSVTYCNPVGGIMSRHWLGVNDVRQKWIEE